MDPIRALDDWFTLNSPLSVMRFDPATLTAIAVVSTLAGTAVTAVGTIAAGKAQQEAAQAAGVAEYQSAQFEASQLDIQAKEERAAAQREMLEHRRRKALALSSLQATAAGSGFSATDPTALALADEIARYGTYQEQLAMYGGESRAAGLRSSAAGRRFTGQSRSAALFAEGRAARTGSYYSAAGTILGGISNAAGKYAKMSAPTGGATGGRYG